MTTSAKDARAFAAVWLGDQPLVPEDARKQDPGTVIAAVRRRLAALKRPRAPVIYRRAPSTSPEKDPLP